MKNALTILDVAVRRDADGRFCINDLHRASGGEKKHGASYWLANQQTKDLIALLETTGIPVVSVEGRKGGTFVAKQLVYAYAMWVSPDFNLQVIDAYDALATGALDEAIRIARRQQDRQAARLEAPALTDAVIHARKVAGKEVEHYHFSNEFDLINRVALGQSAKQYRAAHGLSPDDSIRDTLTALEIKCISHLQRYNASLIDFGLPFEKRKTELHKLYCLQYAGALACEVQMLEA
jgi:hypothetical protein